MSEIVHLRIDSILIAEVRKYGLQLMIEREDGRLVLYLNRGFGEPKSPIGTLNDDRSAELLAGFIAVLKDALADQLLPGAS